VTVKSLTLNGNAVGRRLGADDEHTVGAIFIGNFVKKISTIAGDDVQRFVETASEDMGIPIKITAIPSIVKKQKGDEGGGEVASAYQKAIDILVALPVLLVVGAHVI